MEKDIVISPLKNTEINDSMFESLKTGKNIDHILSSEGGIMRGTNTVVTGEPGIGKSTIVLDILSELHVKGYKVLFINIEMSKMDMLFFCKRFPKFLEIPVLHLSEYSDDNPQDILSDVFQIGFDCIAIDSMVELVEHYIEYFKITPKSANSIILDLFKYHNEGNNSSKIYTSFLILQQLTKGGIFVGTNKLKHLTTAMLELKYTDKTKTSRYLEFSKNRRNSIGETLEFVLAYNSITYGSLNISKNTVEPKSIDLSDLLDSEE